MLGARRHYLVPRALHNAGLLECFFTDASAGPPFCRSLCSLLPEAARPRAVTRLMDREPPGVPRSRIRSFPVFAMRRAWLGRRAVTPSQRLQAYAKWNRAFGELVCKSWPDAADAAYGFNSAALEILRHARSRQARCILDQTAAPWEVEEGVLAEERSMWPGWEFEGAGQADWEPLAEREREEWALADVIVCGSDYVQESVREAGGPDAKCVVIPYGVPADMTDPPERKAHDGPLRVLFAGTIQLRKGIQYLLGAARLLDPASVIIRAVGPIRLSEDAVRQLGEHITLAGARPRSALHAEYSWADVLVAPSVSEGSANVCYEALAAGVPVITTPNAGSVVRDGIEGYIVPIRSPEPLADRITKLAGDAHLLHTLSENALHRAAEFTENRYAERLTAAVKGESP
jgi:glycosyltransferase involved in cell wall biosynthesis